MPMKPFTGSFKNLLVSDYLPIGKFKDKIMFNKFEAEESNGQPFVDFSLEKSTTKSTRVSEKDGELTMKEAHTSYAQTENISASSFQLRFECKFENDSIVPIFELTNEMDETTGKLQFYHYGELSSYLKMSSEGELALAHKKIGDNEWHLFNVSFMGNKLRF